MFILKSSRKNSILYFYFASKSCKNFMSETTVSWIYWRDTMKESSITCELYPFLLYSIGQWEISLQELLQNQYFVDQTLKRMLPHLQQTMIYPTYLYLFRSLMSIQQPHSVTIYIEWLLGFLLGECFMEKNLLDNF